MRELREKIKKNCLALFFASSLGVMRFEGKGVWDGVYVFVTKSEYQKKMAGAEGGGEVMVGICL